MSNARITPIRLTDADCSLFETCHDWWRKEGGVVDANSERMHKLFNHVQFARDDPEAWPPPFLHVGPETTLAFLFGPGFVRSAPGDPGVPDRDVETTINPVYRAVSCTRKPALENVTISLVAHWGPTRCSYDRLVLPAQFKNGTSIFLTATRLVRILSPVTNDWNPKAVD